MTRIPEPWELALRYERERALAWEARRREVPLDELANLLARVGEIVNRFYGPCSSVTKRYDELMLALEDDLGPIWEG